MPIQRDDDSQSKVVRGDLRLPRNDKLRQLLAEIDLGVLDAEAYRTENANRCPSPRNCGQGPATGRIAKAEANLNRRRYSPRLNKVV